MVYPGSRKSQVYTWICAWKVLIWGGKPKKRYLLLWGFKRLAVENAKGITDMTQAWPIPWEIWGQGAWRCLSQLNLSRSSTGDMVGKTPNAQPPATGSSSPPRSPFNPGETSQACDRWWYHTSQNPPLKTVGCQCHHPEAVAQHSLWQRFVQFWGTRHGTPVKWAPHRKWQSPVRGEEASGRFCHGRPGWLPPCVGWRLLLRNRVAWFCRCLHHFYPGGFPGILGCQHCVDRLLKGDL